MEKELVPLIYALRATLPINSTIEEKQAAIVSLFSKLDKVYSGYDNLILIRSIKKAIRDHFLRHETCGEEDALNIRNILHTKGFDPLKKKAINEIESLLKNLTNQDLFNTKFPSFACKRNNYNGYSLDFDCDDFSFFENVGSLTNELNENPSSLLTIEKILKMDLSEFVEHHQWDKLLLLLSATISQDKILQQGKDSYYNIYSTVMTIFYRFMTGFKCSPQGLDAANCILRHLFTEWIITCDSKILHSFEEQIVRNIYNIQLTMFREILNISQYILCLPAQKESDKALSFIFSLLANGKIAMKYLSIDAIDYTKKINCSINSDPQRSNDCSDSCNKDIPNELTVISILDALVLLHDHQHHHSITSQCSATAISSDFLLTNVTIATMIEKMISVIHPLTSLCYAVQTGLLRYLITTLSSLSAYSHRDSASTAATTLRILLALLLRFDCNIAPMIFLSAQYIISCKLNNVGSTITSDGKIFANLDRDIATILCNRNAVTEQHNHATNNDASCNSNSSNNACTAAVSNDTTNLLVIESVPNTNNRFSCVASNNTMKKRDFDGHIIGKDSTSSSSNVEHDCNSSLFAWILNYSSSSSSSSQALSSLSQEQINEMQSRKTASYERFLSWMYSVITAFYTMLQNNAITEKSFDRCCCLGVGKVLSHIIQICFCCPEISAISMSTNNNILHIGQLTFQHAVNMYEKSASSNERRLRLMVEYMNGLEGLATSLLSHPLATSACSDTSSSSSPSSSTTYNSNCSPLLLPQSLCNAILFALQLAVNEANKSSSSNVPVLFADSIYSLTLSALRLANTLACAAAAVVTITSTPLLSANDAAANSCHDSNTSDAAIQDNSSNEYWKTFVHLMGSFALMKLAENIDTTININCNSSSDNDESNKESKSRQDSFDDKRLQRSAVLFLSVLCNNVHLFGHLESTGLLVDTMDELVAAITFKDQQFSSENTSCILTAFLSVITLSGQRWVNTEYFTMHGNRFTQRPSHVVQWLIHVLQVEAEDCSCYERAAATSTTMTVNVTDSCNDGATAVAAWTGSPTQIRGNFNAVYQLLVGMLLAGYHQIVSHIVYQAWWLPLEATSSSHSLLTGSDYFTSLILSSLECTCARNSCSSINNIGVFRSAAPLNLLELSSSYSWHAYLLRLLIISLLDAKFCANVRTTAASHKLNVSSSNRTSAVNTITDVNNKNEMSPSIVVTSVDIAVNNDKTVKDDEEDADDVFTMEVYDNNNNNNNEEWLNDDCNNISSSSSSSSSCCCGGDDGDGSNDGIDMTAAYHHMVYSAVVLNRRCKHQLIPQCEKELDDLVACCYRMNSIEEEEEQLLVTDKLFYCNNCHHINKISLSSQQCLAADDEMTNPTSTTTASSINNTENYGNSSNNNNIVGSTASMSISPPPLPSYCDKHSDPPASLPTQKQQQQEQILQSSPPVVVAEAALFYNNPNCPRVHALMMPWYSAATAANSAAAGVDGMAIITAAMVEADRCGANINAGTTIELPSSSSISNVSTVTLPQTTTLTSILEVVYLNMRHIHCSGKNNDCASNSSISSNDYNNMKAYCQMIWSQLLFSLPHLNQKHEDTALLCDDDDADADEVECESLAWLTAIYSAMMIYGSCNNNNNRNKESMHDLLSTSSECNASQVNKQQQLINKQLSLACNKSSSNNIVLSPYEAMTLEFITSYRKSYILHILQANGVPPVLLVQSIFRQWFFGHLNMIDIVVVTAATVNTQSDGPLFAVLTASAILLQYAESINNNEKISGVEGVAQTIRKCSGLDLANTLMPQMEEFLIQLSKESQIVKK